MAISDPPFDRLPGVRSRGFSVSNMDRIVRDAGISSHYDSLLSFQNPSPSIAEHLREAFTATESTSSDRERRAYAEEVASMVSSMAFMRTAEEHEVLQPMTQTIRDMVSVAYPGSQLIRHRSGLGLAQTTSETTPGIDPRSINNNITKNFYHYDLNHARKEEYMPPVKMSPEIVANIFSKILELEKLRCMAKKVPDEVEESLLNIMDANPDVVERIRQGMEKYITMLSGFCEEPAGRRTPPQLPPNLSPAIMDIALGLMSTPELRESRHKYVVTGVRQVRSTNSRSGVPDVEILLRESS